MWSGNSMFAHLQSATHDDDFHSINLAHQNQHQPFAICVWVSGNAASTPNWPLEVPMIAAIILLLVWQCNVQVDGVCKCCVGAIIPVNIGHLWG